MKTVYWFNELSKANLAEAGGKGASLAEMANSGFPVPSGFIVSSGAYFDFLDANGLRDFIREEVNGLDVNDEEALDKASVAIKKALSEARVPQDTAAEIVRSYNKLCGVALMPAASQEVAVAVRSSATAEDLPEASFAGQQATFLNIKGAEALVAAVRDCWASLFEARAIYYRAQNGFDDLKVGIAVVVQRLVYSDKSGIMFTANPVTMDRNEIIVEGGYGLGEAIVSGAVTPDHFVVSKKDFSITARELSNQSRMVVRSNTGIEWKEVPVEERGKQKLSDAEVIGLARFAKKIEEHYGKPQDLEFAIEGKKLFIVQSRPITTLDKIQTQAKEKEVVQQVSYTNEEKQLVQGAGASPGVASGPVRLVLDAHEGYKVKKGDVLVARMTSPDFVPAMKRAAAIVTDEGGMTCHAAIVSRELGVPCVVGTSNATAVLKEGQIITVDAVRGLVFDGRLEIAVPKQETPATGGGFAESTGTRIYVNLAEPELADKVAARDCDGVGLMRAEFMIAALGKHPKALIKEGKSDEFVDALARGMRKVCSAFYPRPVIYRANDFKSNEYRGLEGGAEFEPQEENPMIGFRGCFRYVRDPDVFKLELAAIKRVREQYKLKNLHLMIPFVRTVHELRVCKQITEDAGLLRSNDFKFGIMCEVPSTVILADEFCKVGIDFMSVGSNDLTQLTLGVDRDSPIVAEDFDERDEAVVKSIANVIKSCHANNVKVSLCGQAPSNYPDFAEMLVEAGIDSISVNPDVIEKTRRVVASAEKRVLLRNARAF
ncbi:MAG: phosphoenolpyruvate synthase [Candidatus Micrarchaeia archaeon]